MPNLSSVTVLLGYTAVNLSGLLKDNCDELLELKLDELLELELDEPKDVPVINSFSKSCIDVIRCVPLLPNKPNFGPNLARRPTATAIPPIRVTGFVMTAASNGAPIKLIMLVEAMLPTISSATP